MRGMHPGDRLFLDRRMPEGAFDAIHLPPTGVSEKNSTATTMGLPPIFYHYFRRPLPYLKTLSLQEEIHRLQLLQRGASGTHRDVLLLLQHRPVYTAGRRQLAETPEVALEAKRLRDLGADFITTRRGGEITYHGPGQIVGYPLIDLSRYTPPMGIRDYICRMQKVLQAHLLEEHGIRHAPSEHTGVFLDERTKIASIGVQVRHRLTSHGFAMNITQEPLPWFDCVVACGLEGVKAGCIADARTKQSPKNISVGTEVGGIVNRFGRIFEREVIKLNVDVDGEMEAAIREVEVDAKEAGDWVPAPIN